MAIVGAAVFIYGDAQAQPIVFTDIAPDPGSGITYRRTKSDTDLLWDAIKIRPFFALPEQVATPAKTRGAPGVAILDYDRDGDLDVYVTNGPGTPHSLYENQLAQTAQLTFVDVAAAAGVEGTDQDGTGVCYGDTDNDGDEDLLVLGRMEPALFYRNEGNGTFTEMGALTGVAQGFRAYTSCSMGDIDNDGLLDIFIANTFDWSREEAIWSDLYSYSHTNELYHNDGGNSFSDVSQSSGILQLVNVPPGDGTISWASSLVDFDQDGDLDIFHADDQGALPPKGFNGINRGLVHILVNDGSGHFTDQTQDRGIDIGSSWMGLSFGDVNCDGLMDYFATTFGDYTVQNLGVPIPPPFNTSSWFLNLPVPGGKFVPPLDAPPPNGKHPLVATPFGWGTHMVDYDNDADSDIVFYGSLDIGPIISADNPGVVLRNEGCNGFAFTWDENATAADADFVRRQGVEGMAMGDLDEDGFYDIVHASGGYAPPALPVTPALTKWGGPFDDAAFVIPQFYAIGPFEAEWAGVNLQDGFLAVKVNSANSNGWVKVEVLGSAGITPSGSVNRDGIGAVVKFTPDGGLTSMTPVLGGSSYASQHSLIQGFGLGGAAQGTADIMWPGGLKNRFYDIQSGEHVLMPEIPCDYAATWPSRNVYRNCVMGALNDLRTAGIINNAQRTRLRNSALQAYDDTH
jgi:hypothetical protein